MPIADEDIIEVDLPPLTAAEASFLPEVFKGLGTTLKHLIGSVGRGHLNRALCYPEERREDIVRLERFVDAYEGRITALEKELKLMRETMTEAVEGLPPADQDLPPHY